MFAKLTSALSVMVLAAAPCFGDAYTFAVLPPSEVSGPPDSLVGWGYTLSNQSPTNWLVAAGLNSDGFLYGTGTPLFDFPVLTPTSSVTVSFDPALRVGLYELRWDNNAPLGWTNSGTFTLSAEWWNGDPANGGIFIGLAADGVQPYSATVLPPAGGAPEPMSGLLAIAGLAIFAIMKRRLRRRFQ